MSATGRGAARVGTDLYETPAWSTRVFLESGALSVPHPDAVWLEPSAGGGAIVREVSAWCADRGAMPPHWRLIEARRGAEDNLVSAARLAAAAPMRQVEIQIEDFLDLSPPECSLDVAIGNPPYSLAFEFVRKLVDERWADRVALLLRAGFLESERRYSWLQQNVPDVYPMASRPSFVNNATDAAMYAWMVWHPGKARTSGQVVLLPPRRKR